MENSAQIPNPLLRHHHAADAEMLSYDQLEIVNTFGEPQAEYAALHKSYGVLDIPFRGMLELTGRDRLTFLNGLISNQTWDKNTKQPMPAGTWVYAFLLNLKGRIVADMDVVELGDATFVITDVRLVDALRGAFEKYLFADQVKMLPLVGALHPIGIYGPQATSTLQIAAGHGSEFPAGQVAARVRIGDVQCVAYRDSPTGTDGWNLLIPTESAAALWSSLLDSGTPHARGRAVGWAAFNACRIEAGRALFGIDFAGAPPATAYPTKKARDEAEAAESAPGVLPAETGVLFNRAVNLTKCYIGQEIVARMYARQQTARQLAGFRMQEDALPLAGSTVHDAEGNHIGVVTSSTISPVLSNAAIGLAFVKRPHFIVGAKLTIPAEGGLRTATVVELPFVKPSHG